MVFICVKVRTCHCIFLQSSHSPCEWHFGSLKLFFLKLLGQIQTTQRLFVRREKQLFIRSVWKNIYRGGVREITYRFGKSFSPKSELVSESELKLRTSSEICSLQYHTYHFKILKERLVLLDKLIHLIRLHSLSDLTGTKPNRNSVWTAVDIYWRTVHLSLAFAQSNIL